MIKTPIIQITGLSGAGKTTLSLLLAKRLREEGHRVEVLDGDEYRKALCNQLGFSREDRVENINRLSFLAKVLARNGVVPILAAINPYEAQRKGIGGVVAHIKCDYDVLLQRDTKGLYKKHNITPATINKLFGTSDAYEEPNPPDIVIDTSLANEAKSFAQLYNKIKAKLPYPLLPPERIDPGLKGRMLGIDFDGVIHLYSQGFLGLDNAYDIPMEGTEHALRVLNERGYYLWVYSTRPPEVIEEWLIKYDLLKYIPGPITNIKLPAINYIDDHGYHFSDWEKVLDDFPSLK